MPKPMKNKTISNNQTELTQDKPKLVGAFEEGSLCQHGVLASTKDWTDEAPCFLEDDGVFLEPPTFITRTRSNQLRDD